MTAERPATQSSVPPVQGFPLRLAWNAASNSGGIFEASASHGGWSGFLVIRLRSIETSPPTRSALPAKFYQTITCACGFRAVIVESITWRREFTPTENDDAYVITFSRRGL